MWWSTHTQTIFHIIRHLDEDWRRGYLELVDNRTLESLVRIVKNSIDSMGWGRTDPILTNCSTCSWRFVVAKKRNETICRQQLTTIDRSQARSTTPRLDSGQRTTSPISHCIWAPHWDCIIDDDDDDLWAWVVTNHIPCGHLTWQDVMSMLWRTIDLLLQLSSQL